MVLQTTDAHENATAAHISPEAPTWLNGRFFSTTVPFRSTPGTGILLVSDTQYGGPKNYYSRALDAGGYSYDYWRCSYYGDLSGEVLSQEAFAQYHTLIWFMDDWSRLSTGEQDALAGFLGRGGHLFITGQQLARKMSEDNPQFYSDWLKSSLVSDFSDSWVLTGTAHPIASGMHLTIRGGDGANDEPSPDVIGFDPEFARPLFLYDSAGNGDLARPTTEPGVGPIAAVAAEYPVDEAGTLARVVNFAFGFEAINNPNDRVVVMDRVLSWLSGSEPQFVLLGDVSGNGEVQAYDAALILRHVVGLETIPEERLVIADVDGSGGEPTALDAALILQYAVGLIGAFPAAARPVADAAPARSIGFLQRVAAESGREVAVPLLIQGDRPIVSAQLAMRYDPAVLTFKSVRLGDKFDGFLEAHKADNGLLKLAAAGQKQVPSGCVLAELVFDVVGPNGAKSSLAFQSFRINDQAVETADLDVTVGADLPKAFALDQNYPNPFNPETVIAYALAEESRVVLDIYNVSGQMVRRLVDQRMAAGFHKVRWDGKDMQGNQVTSGIYFYRIQAGSFSAGRKMTVLK